MKQVIRYGFLLTLAGTTLAADRPPVDSGDVQLSEEFGAAIATRELGAQGSLRIYLVSK